MADFSTVLIARLSARGVTLREAAQARDIEAFEAVMGWQMTKSAREIYSLFNGFRLADQKSQVCLWGLDEIARRNSDDTDLHQGTCLAIGDVLIDSDFLTTDLSKEAPVTLLFEKTTLQQTMTDFIEQLSSGRFDLEGSPPI